MIRNDLTGKRFGRLVVTEFSHLHKQPSGQTKVKWKCACDCGNTVVLMSSNLMKEGHSTSCGCFRKERQADLHRTHDMSHSRTHKSYTSMLERCLNPKRTSYPKYGGAGITVCERWQESFENFYEDMGERPEGTTLNRIGSVSVYSKETCEWATYSIQGYDQKMKSNNSSGKCGVSLSGCGKKWVAGIGHNSEKIHLGTFDTYEAAAKARDEAELKYFGWNK